MADTAAQEGENQSNNQMLHKHKPKSKSIGVVVSSISNNFFSEVINGIDSVAVEHNYHVIITQSHESLEKEVQNLKLLSSRGVDGVLISLSCETTETGHLKELINQEIPVVLFDRISRMKL